MSKLKNDQEKSSDNIKREEFESFLLNGPVFSKKQIDVITKARKAINQLRIKEVNPVKGLSLADFSFAKNRQITESYKRSFSDALIEERRSDTN